MKKQHSTTVGICLMAFLLSSILNGVWADEVQLIKVRKLIRGTNTLMSSEEAIAKVEAIRAFAKDLPLDQSAHPKCRCQIDAKAWEGGYIDPMDGHLTSYAFESIAEEELLCKKFEGKYLEVKKQRDKYVYPTIIAKIQNCHLNFSLPIKEDLEKIEPLLQND